MALNPVVDGQVNRSKGRQMMEDAVNELNDNNLDARVPGLTDDSLIWIMENKDNDHNMAFVKGSLRRAIRSMLTSMLDEEGFRDGSETAVL